MSTLVIGGGQAGLAVGYHLARRGQDFTILDAEDSIGARWRHRWDSLRLFTPAGFNGLPGLAFPGPRDAHPGKDAVADYLADYADRFSLPVRLNTAVHSLSRDDDGLLVRSADHSWRPRRVVLACGAHTAAIIPPAAARLDRDIVQLHSADYRRPDQLPSGPVLVVGAGNSGAEIALDLATDPAVERSVLLSGRDVGTIPNFGPWTYPILRRLGPLGATFAAKGLRGGGDPLGRIRPGQLEAAGVRRVPRVAAVAENRPVLADGRDLAVNAVVWCTGLRPDYSWLHLDATDERGMLRHRRGVVIGQPGLFAVGLPYQRSITSHLIGGVGHDAGYIAAHVDA